MRDLPVVLSGYKRTVVEPPAPKMRDDWLGDRMPVTDRHGVAQFVVSLFVKLRVETGQRAPKGEEIKVTLATDPGPGFEEDARVELIDPRMNATRSRPRTAGRSPGSRSRPSGWMPPPPLPRRRGRTPRSTDDR